MDLIIIGAPRSGTNMLRDTLCQLPGLGTWPCDEINLVWRYGNARWSSDALPPELAREGVRRYIRRAFARRRRAAECRVVVEKTCANSLRVPFVDRVLPQARYLFIYRNPYDAVASAALRWHAPFDLGYTLAKARFAPLGQLPYQGWRFLVNRFHRLVSRESRVALWGPRIEGMEELVRERSLLEVCALQWRECVLRSAEAFRQMPPGRVHLVAYEDFVADPVAHLRQVCAFLEISPDESAVEAAVADVSPASVGKGRSGMTAAERRAVGRIVDPASRRLEAFLQERG